MGAAALGLKLLGFGKTLLGWLLGLLKGILDFAFKKPFQFLTIALALALLWCGWYGVSTKRELVETQKVVEEKTKYIKGQQVTITQYVKALDVEKKNHIRDIRKSNDAVDGLRKAADKALAKAQAAGREALKDKRKFDQLGDDYGRANPSTGTAEQRILREQATNDSFIKDWRKAQ
jgi:hypothetical protein